MKFGRIGEKLEVGDKVLIADSGYFAKVMAIYSWPGNKFQRWFRSKFLSRSEWLGSITLRATTGKYKGWNAFRELNAEGGSDSLIKIY